MDGTPKLKKRNALSLSRLNHKRLSSEQSASAEVPRSPSVVSLCSDGGIECTPPRKKFSLDDSVDYSPKNFDDSYSPSGLLSQSLVVDSPEVGWRWCRRNAPSEISNITPDSAYAAESSFASAGSSSTDTGRSRSNSTSQRPAYERRRKAAELEMRRAEKMRADELLKQRCARLQEQLDRNREKENEKLQVKKVNSEQNIDAKTSDNSTTSSSSTTTNTQSSTLVSAEIVKNLNSSTSNANECLNDFWNDSADSFLLEATQQVESKILELTQKTEAAVIATAEEKVSPDSTQKIVAPVIPVVATVSNSAPVTTNITSLPREKRSSLYMKFLEDETPDDWFLSLDEAILQATQTPKTRSSFQRYNSMPSATKTTSSVNSVGKSTTITTAKTATTTQETSGNGNVVSSFSINRNGKTGANTVAAAGGSAAKMKRHCSSNALSPSSSNSSHRGGRQLHFRK